MFDIKLCVLACTKNEKYLNRLKEFVEIYGYKKLNKKLKLKIVYLVEDEPRPSLINSKDTWFNCPNIPMSLRWLKYLEETNLDSKWIMQVDDDSATDIDKTIEILNQFYDYNDPMILMGGRNTDLETSQQQILKELKIQNIFCNKSDISTFDTIPHFVHAWEPSIMSLEAVKKLQNWKHLQKYYKLCEKYKPTFGDQTPYVAAKLAKIPIVEASFLCPFENGSQYTGININGQFSHIHYVTDKWVSFNNFKKALIEKKQFKTEIETETFLHSNIKNINPIDNTVWNFYGNGKLYGKIKFNPDGIISMYNNDNEKFWKYENNTIILFDKFRNITSILSKITDTKFEGKFVSNGTTHTIQKIV